MKYKTWIMEIIRNNMIFIRISRFFYHIYTSEKLHKINELIYLQ